MNKTILLGRLTKDPEVRYTNNGKCVTQLTLAVDRPFTGQDGKREADFIPVIFWGKTAEAVGNYVSKGQRLLVEGRLQIRSYDDKNGQKRWVTEIIGTHAEFIEKKEQGVNAGSANSNAGYGNSNFESMGQEVQFDEQIPF